MRDVSHRNRRRRRSTSSNLLAVVISEDERLSGFVPMPSGQINLGTIDTRAPGERMS